MFSPPSTFDDVDALVQRMCANEMVTRRQRELIIDIVAKFYCDDSNGDLPPRTLIVRRPMHEPGYSHASAVLATIMLIVASAQSTFERRVTHTWLSTGRRMARKLLEGIHRCMRVADADFDAVRSNVEVIETTRWRLVSVPANTRTMRGIGGDLLSLHGVSLDEEMMREVVVPLLQLRGGPRLLVDAQFGYADDRAGRELERASDVMRRYDGDEE